MKQNWLCKRGRTRGSHETWSALRGKWSWRRRQGIFALFQISSIQPPCKHCSAVHVFPSRRIARENRLPYASESFVPALLQVASLTDKLYWTKYNEFKRRQDDSRERLQQCREQLDAKREELDALTRPKK